MTLNRLKLSDFQFILLIILPIAFVVGPFVVELIVNTLIIIFIFNVLKKKEFGFVKNKIFIFLIFFYFILLLSQFNSDYFDETKVNVLFYIRFILFPFAVYEILKINSKYFKYLFLSLLITILIVSIDGYIQFFFEKNLLGYEKYRVDRISGFFKEDLILGSYLSRILPLFIGIAIYFKDQKNLSKISIFTVGFCILLIFLSGERAPFIKTLIGLIIIFLIININWKVKILFLLFVISSILFVISTSPVIFDRHVKQMKNHLFTKDHSTNKLIFIRNYYPMYQTSIKMFKDDKILGKGPKTYRYHCNDPKFITFYPNKDRIIDNTVLKIDLSWKELGSINISEFFISENDIIKKNDKLFSYNFIGKNKIYTYYSNKEGTIEKIIKKNSYNRNDTLLHLDPKNSPDKEIKRISACNTHPHNFYFQLLAETGFLGFIYVFIFFLMISFLLIKNFIFNIINKSKKATDSELCILIGFFLFLWPLTTNGNFFNNWINLMSFYPLGIYLFLIQERINAKNNL